MDNDREDIIHRERRTKQKRDHPAQSESPQGVRRNIKQTAQRGGPQRGRGSGYDQSHPSGRSARHWVGPDGSDGFWSLEEAYIDTFNPATRELQIDERERSLRRYGRRILPGVCPSTPRSIPTPFDQHQVQADFFPQLRAPQVQMGYTPRLPKSYAKQSIAVTKQRAYDPYLASKDEILDKHF